MYNFITLGNDCSPAAALRNLQLRDVALPFDWVVSTFHFLNECFENNFKKYHTDLKFNSTHTRLIDSYGFEFPHDYPVTNYIHNNEQIGEGSFGEDTGRVIVEDWVKYYDIVKEKYNRRIERFLNIMRDNTPLIVLTRYNAEEVSALKIMLEYHFNRKDVVIVNSCETESIFNDIICCNTEKNGTWNDSAIWKENIEKAIDIVKNKYPKRV